jgi:ATF/CREB family transcription factor
MLARGGNDAQSTNQFAATSGVPGHAHPAPVAPQRIIPSQQMSWVNWDPIGSARGMSMISIASDESEQARLNTRGMGKRNPSPTNGRRKADESTVQAPTNKKSKANANAAATNSDMDLSDEGSTMRLEESVSMSKMTNEENRKNFLERNRYVLQSLIVLYCGSLLTPQTSVAAHKCRLRRKQWLTQLQTRVGLFTTENNTLMAQIAHLREETVNLKTLLLAHKDCPVAYRQELYSASMSQVIKPYNL